MLLLTMIRRQPPRQGLHLLAVSVPTSRVPSLSGSAFSFLSSFALSLFCKKSAKLTLSFSNTSALFKKECSRNSFSIKSFRTLLQNTGGNLSRQPKNLPLFSTTVLLRAHTNARNSFSFTSLHHGFLHQRRRTHSLSVFLSCNKPCVRFHFGADSPTVISKRDGSRGRSLFVAATGLFSWPFGSHGCVMAVTDAEPELL
jgi:hypothetical protein